MVPTRQEHYISSRVLTLFHDRDHATVIVSTKMHYRLRVRDFTYIMYDDRLTTHDHLKVLGDDGHGDGASKHLPPCARERRGIPRRLLGPLHHLRRE